jgi:hypothetical protein
VSTDPYIREIGRVEDSQGRILIVGVNFDAVTLGLGGGGTVQLGSSQVEELAQMLVSATWQAAWQVAASLGAAAAQAPTGGAP